MINVRNNDTRNRVWPLLMMSACACTCMVFDQPAAHAQTQPASDRCSSIAQGPWTDGVPAERQEVARTSFQNARAREDRADLEAAKTAYLLALSNWDHPKIHGNLAHLLARLDRPREAYAHVRQALRYGELPYTCEQTVLADLRRLATRLRKRVSEVIINCPRGAADVTLNGTRLCERDRQERVLLEAREHTLVAEAAGKTSVTRIIGTLGGERTTIDLQLSPVRKFAAWKPWLLVGSGVLLGALGGVSHARARTNLARADDLADTCPSGPEGCPADSHKSQAIRVALEREGIHRGVAIVSYVSGAALLISGVALVFYNQARTSEVYERGDRRGLTVVPMIELGAAGKAELTLQWRF